MIARAVIWLALCGALLFATPVAAAQVDDTGRLNSMLDKAMAQASVDPDAAFVAAEKSAVLARQNFSGQARDVLLSQADAVLAKVLFKLRRTDEAEKIVGRALGRGDITVIPPKFLGELTLTKARLYQQRDDVQSALGTFQQAYAIFRSAGEKRSQAVALQSIAKLYADGGDGETALRYYAQSVDEYSGDPLMSLSSHNNRGSAYLYLLKPREAELEFNAALAASKRLGSTKYNAQILANIAQAQIAQGRYGVAATALERSFASVASAGPGYETFVLWDLRAQIAFARKDYRTATTAIEHALRGVDPATSDSTYRQAHDNAYKIYRATGRQALALIHLEARARLDEATAKLTATNSAALMAARFDFANQNTRIAQLKASELELQRNFLIAVVAGGTLVLLLLSGGLILITRSRNRERAAKLLLAQTNRDLEKAIAAKMEFLATTSHEIRTPLNGILGMTQVMLTDRKLDATLRDRIGIVHDAGETMRSLVDDILDVAKMETGKLAVGTGTVDLKATLRHVAQVWRLQAEAAGIGLVLNLDDCPEQMEGDAGRIRQIVFNLLSNAMKFTEKGKVELAVRADPDAGRIRISVRDSGIGIAREWHESIFELFQQVDGGTTRKYGGTGLGLAICRNLARAMGGDITVESEPGFGSTFTIDLPLVESAKAPDRPASSERPGTVLVIEHNPLTRGMIRAILSERFEVISFVEGVAEACSFLALDEADWILVDAASVDDFTKLFDATDIPVAVIDSGNLSDDVCLRARVVLAKPLTKTALLNIFAADVPAVAVAA